MVDDDEDLLSDEDDEAEEEGNSGFFHVNVDRKMDTPNHGPRKPCNRFRFKIIFFTLFHKKEVDLLNLF